jgi:tripartite-type tricarboxylate transporter receptor subunit TctC
MATTKQIQGDRVKISMRISCSNFFIAALMPILLVGAGIAHAQTYPAKRISIVVPYPPGGINDVFGRLIGKKLQEELGQPTIVENKPGAGTIIGTDAVAKAAPDGYTLLIVSFPFVANPSLYRKLPYSPVKDFVPISLLVKTPNIAVVSASSPIKSIGDLIAAAKTSPGKLVYASAGSGASNHLAAEMFKRMAGVDIRHIPYKGSGPSMTDLLGGHIDVMFDNPPSSLPHIRAGKLRALAVSSANRSAQMPDIPTVAESGVPGYDVTTWIGIAAPAGTPPAIVEKLNRTISKIITMDDVKKAFNDQGAEVAGGSVDDFAKFLMTETAKWAKVVSDANIAVD